MADDHDDFDSIIDAALARPRESRPAPSRHLSDIVVVTTETLLRPGVRITEMLPMVAARRALGSWSNTIEESLGELEREMFDALRNQAVRLGAHAIVAAQIRFTQVQSPSGSFVVFAVAHGTPVVLEPLN